MNYALNTPDNRILFDKYMPVEAEIQQLADMMQHFNLTEDRDITGLVEDKYAMNADIQAVESLSDIIR